MAILLAECNDALIGKIFPLFLPSELVNVGIPPIIPTSQLQGTVTSNTAHWLPGYNLEISELFFHRRTQILRVCELSIPRFTPINPSTHNKFVTAWFRTVH